MFLCLPWHWWMWSLASRDCRGWERVNSVFNHLTTLTPLSLSSLQAISYSNWSFPTLHRTYTHLTQSHPFLACNAGLERDSSYLPLTVQRRVGVNHTCIVAWRLTWLSSDNTHPLPSPWRHSQYVIWTDKSIVFFISWALLPAVQTLPRKRARQNFCAYFTVWESYNYWAIFLGLQVVTTKQKKI